MAEPAGRARAAAKIREARASTLWEHAACAPLAGLTWKLLSRPCQNQLRWMISNTADPGCMNCELARLEVCTETSTVVDAIVSSCSRKGVEALNSTTRTYAVGSRTRAMAACHTVQERSGAQQRRHGFMQHEQARELAAEAGEGGGCAARAMARPHTTPHPPAHLAKLAQHVKQLWLIDHPPVGALALEGDGAGQRLAQLGGRQAVLRSTWAGWEGLA